jgi:hypothetical protein
MKRYTIPCAFPDGRAPVSIYVGEPAHDAHPLEQQAAWLLRERGGVIPVEVMDSFRKLMDIALDNNVSFEALTELALGGAEASAEDEAAG